MASLPHPKTITYEEWLRTPETKREEVVNGEIRKMSAPKWSHTRIVQNLYDQIHAQVDGREVIVVNSAFDLIIRRQPLTARQPDLAVFEATTIIEEDERIHSAPQLIAEVLSPSNTRRELAGRLADYAELGVPEIWVFSYEARTAEVLHLENGRYVRHALLAEGLLTPIHFPSVAVDIAKVWPE